MNVFILILTLSVFGISDAENCLNSDEIVDIIESKLAENKRALDEKERQFTERLRTLEIREQKCTERENEVENRLQAVERALVNGNENNNYTKRQVSALTASPVAFSACVSVPELYNVQPHQTIIFDQVTTNLGSGYHSRLGVFFAPLKGVYVFHVTVIASGGQAKEVALVKDGVEYHRIIVDSFNTNGYTSTTGSWVLELEQQSEVFVQSVVHPGDIHGNCYSTFAGFLLQELA